MKPARPFLVRSLLTLLALLVSTSGVAMGAPGDPPEADYGLSQTAVQAGVPYGWAFERADDPVQFSDLTGRYLRFDASGRPHVAYGGDHLYYAVFDGAGWNVTTVDEDFGVGRYASLALDGNNRPHISYYDSVNGDLKYAYFDGTSWSIDIIDGFGPLLQSEGMAMAETAEGLVFEQAVPGIEEFSPEVVPLDPLTAGIHPDAYFPGIDAAAATTGIGVGLFTSIAIDNNGDPGISYYDISGGNLKYAVRKGGAWSTQLVDRGGDRNYDVGLYTSLAFDSSGRPRISYRDESNDTLKFASFTGSNWVSEVVDRSANVGAFSSLALDRNNRPHLSYYDGTSNDLKHAWLVDGDWKTETVDSSGDVGAYSSIVIDDANRPWVSYYDATTGSLKLAVWNDDDDELEPKMVLNTGRRGLYSTIAVSGGNLGIVFFNEPLERLQYVYKPSASGWGTPVDLAQQNRVGISTSIDVAGDGTTYVSYMNDTTDRLHFAMRKAGAWTVDRTTFPTGTGQYSSLKVDSAGRVHLAYYDQANGDLDYALFDGSAWSHETIASGGDVGMFVSLAVDSSNTPHVAFFDKTNADLMYGRKAGASWQVSSIAGSAGEGNDDYTGEFPSIALNSSGVPSIAFYNADNDADRSRLEYATFNPGSNSWSFQTVDTGSGLYPSLALAPDGSPRIAYYYRDLDSKGNVVGTLRYAALSAGSWMKSTLDSGGVVGLWPSLKLVNNEIHISYFDQGRNNLKYAHWTARGWTETTVDLFGDVGMYTSLAVGSNNLPQISYFDRTNGDLKVAFASLLDQHIFLPVVRN